MNVKRSHTANIPQIFPLGVGCRDSLGDHLLLLETGSAHHVGDGRHGDEVAPVGAEVLLHQRQHHLRQPQPQRHRTAEKSHSNKTEDIGCVYKLTLDTLRAIITVIQGKSK